MIQIRTEHYFKDRIQEFKERIGKPKYPALLEQLKEHLSDLELAEQQYQHKDLFMLFNGKLSQTEIIDKRDNNTIYANVPLALIDFNDWPSHDTNILDEGIHSLSGSIMEVGFINPIILRPKIDTIGKYEVVDGNRRVRAARIAKIRFIPSIIKKDLSGNDFEVMIQKLVLHLHTEPLPDEKVEEATELLKKIKITRS